MGSSRGSEERMRDVEEDVVEVEDDNGKARWEGRVTKGIGGACDMRVT